jgi:succinate-semialdehyde dehydrogenase/glutarate-semialdehyde dehydrogenase
VANASEFGLGGSIWTRDLERGVRVARRIEAGTLFVNSFVKSDPRMPFGGVKKSGIGRELSKYGLREFVNVKGINVYQHG